MRIGLLGGSFDPAHQGHRHVATTACKRLGLHQVWWIPAHAHPFKTARTAFATRLESARAMATAPQMRVSDIEARRGIVASIELVRLLRARLGATHFVWLVGEDILLSAHRWRQWTQLARLLPIAVVARPGGGARAGLSHFATQYRTARWPEHAACAVPLAQAPAWVRLGAPLNHAASRDLACSRGHAATDAGAHRA